MKINSPRGTQDILPPDSFDWQFLENKAHEISENYNYQEIRTPVFEYTELFNRGIGEATDIVEKEMYTFEDRGGRSITLRPEMTASVVRSFLENKIYGRAQPTKYYYIGPMFRYERPQSGRYRQFHQFGVEVLGSNDPDIDVELMAMGIDYLEKLGLKDFFVELNSIGCPECRPDYVADLQEHFSEHEEELCSDCRRRLTRNPLRILDCDECAETTGNAPEILDYICSQCHDHFAQVKEGLEQLKIDFHIEPHLVRGLDYYTNTVFEVKSHDLGAQNAIFSGGRYNGLVEEIGDRDVPGSGWALGLERLLLVLEEQRDEDIKSDLDVYVIKIGARAEKLSLSLLRKLRRAGFSADTDYGDRSVGSQMKDADRKNSDYSIIVGEDEIQKDSLTLRDMNTGEEKMIAQDKIVDVLADKIQ
ncbi:histidine--tRNA ligase [Halarsenatibacter silvermanii]|uniref:Histidine--tRNA ligase n=1 Tax=Halarsenatibacter silvermanii TaxID=321763 RepID=A0A1G9JQS1_9FIRM|nr:histidine--tRNA ligase [Halarsenatibacter silvermanii]SDL39791.1 histidyl-tRNA synthetase [Halarsenatibacter silvermanii]